MYTKDTRDFFFGCCFVVYLFASFNLFNAPITCIQATLLYMEYTLEYDVY